jgi:hypothetical protein
LQTNIESKVKTADSLAVEQSMKDMERRSSSPSASTPTAVGQLDRVEQKAKAVKAGLPVSNKGRAYHA